MAKLSKHIAEREPSAVRLANLILSKRTDDVTAINLAIGNVQLPMHPKMISRMKQLGNLNSEFEQGVVSYTPTSGTTEAKLASLKFIKASGGITDGLEVLVTNGGSQAMSLAVLATAGELESGESKPILLFEPAYTNYKAFANRYGIEVVSLEKKIDENNNFVLPNTEEIEAFIQEHKPNAIVVIPYNNPTGSFYNQSAIDELARIAIKYDIWLISDEAYRGLHYSEDDISSIWKINTTELPEIKGKRISIETSSKVWNGCGLRIGGLVCDSENLYNKLLAEATATLGANAIGQHIFSAINDISIDEIHEWFRQQRDYYDKISEKVISDLKLNIPEIIVNKPGSALYTIIDLVNVVDENFDAKEFVSYCASEGQVEIGGTNYTLLLAPLSGFYSKPSRAKTKLRLAFVEPTEIINHTGTILAKLLENYKNLN